MAIKICDQGHLTGIKNCWCGAKANTVQWPSGMAPHWWYFVPLDAEERKRSPLSKRYKRGITQMLRDMGHVPVADL